MKKTLKAKILILNILFAFSFTACNNEDDDDTVDPNNTNASTCQLVKEAEMGDDDYNEFEYNAQGFITKVIDREAGSNATDEYTSFIYNSNNQLIKLEYNENGQKDGYINFEYTNDLITIAKEYDQKGVFIDNTTFKYDSNKRLSEIGYDDFIVKFTYDSKGNILTEEGINQGKVGFRKTYENYDDKFTPYAAVKGLPVIFTRESRNNPGKTNQIYDKNGDGILQPTEGEVTTYTYKYNANGYPTEVKETSGTDSETNNYTYNCK